jgi:arsenate reductase
MTDKIYNVLFLSAGISVRSIMPECALNRWGQDRFQAYSAGSHPKGRVHPTALRLLRNASYETDGLRSKSWAEFARPEARSLDFVFLASLPIVSLEQLSLQQRLGATGTTIPQVGAT